VLHSVSYNKFWFTEKLHEDFVTFIMNSTITGTGQQSISSSTYAGFPVPGGPKDGRILQY
jgi:hypothetical protein